MNRCSIILVHGTWGRGFFPEISDLRRRYLFLGNKRWFEEGSQFLAGLNMALKSASLDWPVRAFLWNGANSVHARDCAARKLSEELRKDLQDDPDSTAVIIAHSHGGNVALRALQHLGSMADRVRVVTLATPFLRVYAMSGLPSSANILLWVGITAILILISIGVLVLTGIARGSYFAGFALGLSLAAVAAAALIVSGLNKLFVAGKVAETIAKAADYQKAAPRMLVLRGVDDEASLSLAAGSIGSRLSYLQLVVVLPLLFLIAFLWALVVPAVTDLRFFNIIAVVCILGGPLFLVLPGVFKSAFGREFLLNAIGCDIAADSIPDTVNKVEAKTLPPEAVPFLQLRHGIYNHPDCVDEIVCWLRRAT